MGEERFMGWLNWSDPELKRDLIFWSLSWIVLAFLGIVLSVALSIGFHWLPIVGIIGGGVLVVARAKHRG